MFFTALWILEKEVEGVRKGTSNWPSVQDEPEAYAILGSFAIMQTVVITAMPYHSLYMAQAAAEWTVKDIAYTSATGMQRGHYTRYPGTLAFAKRGGWRFAATKVGSRFLGPIGVALLMVDAWKTGIWIGEKLFGEMD